MKKGRRQSRQGDRGCYRGQGRVNVNVKIPDVITKQQVIDIVNQKVHQDEKKAVFNDKPQGVIDAAAMTWDEFEDELEWIETEMERREDVFAKQHEIEHVVYTEAWDAQPIINFALSVYQALEVGAPDLARYRGMDIIAFTGYVCAIAETFLLGNQDIVGVAGYTQDNVNRAKAILQGLCIPEIIGLMLLQLRPKLLDDGTKVVLLPHKFDVHQAQAHNINWNNQQPVDANIDLQQYQFYVQNIGQAVGAANNHANANHLRTNWMKDLMDTAVQANARYSPAELNRHTDGSRSIYQYYEQATITAAIFNANRPTVYGDFVWDCWFSFDMGGFCARNVKRHFINFGNKSCYMVKKKRNIPVNVRDANNGNVLREPTDPRERWIPWMVCPTEAALIAVIGEIQGQINTCIVHNLTMHERVHVIPIVKLARLKRLAQGHGDAMTTNPLA